MLAKLKALLGSDFAETDAASSEDDMRLACAALMVEVATIDNQFDKSESQALITALKAQFQLTETEATALVTFAETARHDATSLHEFTREVNESCTPEAKFELIKGMWSVAYADGHLDKYEEHIIRRAAELIHLGHSDFIRAKLAVKK